MKKLLYMSIALALTAGCNNLEDDDYFKSSEVRNTNAEVTSTSQTVAEYIQGRSDLSKMSALFQSQGIYEEMKTSGELHTVLVVTDDNYAEPEAEEAEKSARSHVTNISVAPSKLNDGDRLLMWHNKYVSVGLDEQAKAGNLIGHIQFNSSSLKEVVKGKDGYIYVISDMIVTPTSLQDYINGLDDSKYGKFKQMVTASGGQEFDKTNSKIIGVDSYGNTIYDTVWIYTNEFFDAKNFDLSSEALNATMLVFSDSVIDAALTEAKDKLHAWGYDHKTELMRNGSLDSVYVGYSSYEDLEDWILQVAFFRQRYTAEELTADMEAEDQTVNDVTSIYSRKWRTSKQKLDLDNPVELSNGIAYEVKECHIPNNRLIYRLHEPFSYYSQCSAEEKAEYFKMTNLGSVSVKNTVSEWTPLAGVWPAHGDNSLTCKLEDTTNPNYGMDFTPIYSRSDGEGGYEVGPMLVPPGEYKFRMGFAQYMAMNLTVQVGVYHTADEIDWFFTSEPIALASAGTAYHYDRGAMCSTPRLPEYYDPNDSRNTAGSKNAYYWTDGGTITDALVVPDLDNGNAERLVFRMTATDGSASTGTLTFNHWCLRPTDNNY